MRERTDSAASLARALGIHETLARRALDQGCPRDVAGARRWLAARGMKEWRGEGKTVWLSTT